MRISYEYFSALRNPDQCYSRWYNVLRTGLIKGPWTSEELRNGLFKPNTPSVAYPDPGPGNHPLHERRHQEVVRNRRMHPRPHQQAGELCNNNRRARRVPKTVLTLSRSLSPRRSAQCRERWHNHLDPTLKRGRLTDEEDAILIRAQASLGNAWSKICRLLPQRSENNVKNRWNSSEMKKMVANHR